MTDASYALLTVLADTLDGMERERLSMENRYRAFVSEAANEYDTAKGLAGTPEAELLADILAGVKRSEREVTKRLEDAVLAHPLGGFLAERKGVGAKGLGRLLGAIGDPTYNALEERRRRGPAELWAYCGYAVHDGARPRRQRGVKINWSARGKVATYRIAESAYRQGQYAPVYRTAREGAACKVHTSQCQNRVRPPGRSNGCGTAENPELGAPGSPWRRGHQHQHAVSLVGKRMLQDLFVYAKDLTS